MASSTKNRAELDNSTSAKGQQAHDGAKLPEAVKRMVDGYSDEPRPLGSYLGVMSVFSAAFGIALWAAHRSNRLPDKVRPADVLLVGVATHKLSRTLAKDLVTSPLRAPFTRLEGETDSEGPNEVSEKSRGDGLQKTIGELVSCPWCLGAWISAGMTYGLTFAPRATRMLGTLFAVNAISDWLNAGYDAAQKGISKMGAEPK
jgi:hypothetical protein